MLPQLKQGFSLHPQNGTAVKHILTLTALWLAPPIAAFAADSSPANKNWKHSGSVFVITTPEGADLPATALVEGFPLLMRLHKNVLDFKQSKANGEDLRFSSSTGEPLAYQIEE